MATNIGKIQSAPRFVGISVLSIHYGSSSIPISKPEEYSDSNFYIDVSPEINPKIDMSFDIYVQDVILQYPVDSYNHAAYEWCAYHNNGPYLRIGYDTINRSEPIEDYTSKRVYIEFAPIVPTISMINDVTFGPTGPSNTMKRVSFNAKTKIWKSDRYISNECNILLQIFIY